MNDQSQELEVGKVAVGAYLDAVEQALIDADAPRGDRMQVTQDLESQIADMLAQQPRPLTEESVGTVLAALEPPAHFSAMYGSAEPDSHTTAPPAKYSTWLLAAAGAMATAIVLMLMVLLVASSGGGGRAAAPVAVILLLCEVAAIVLVPLALRFGIQQLRSEPTRYKGHELALVVASIYWSLVPLTILIMISVVTEGVALIIVGAVLFLALQYRLIKQYRQSLRELLVTDPLGGRSTPSHMPDGKPDIGLDCRAPPVPR